MPKMPTPEYKSFLIDRKFPEYVRFKQKLREQTNRRKIVSSVSPFTQGHVRKHVESENTNEDTGGKSASTLLDKVKDYKTYLDGLTEVDLADLYTSEVRKKNAEEEQERFFNQPHATADFDYWSKMAHWTLDEAVALSFGKSPMVVNKNSLASVHGWPSPFVQEYNKTLELAQRAIPWKKLLDPVMPSLFIKWAKDTEIPLPDKLVEKVEARSGKLLDWKKMYEELLEKNNNNVQIANEIIAEKDGIIAELQSQTVGNKHLGTREKESLLKLVIGMAAAAYVYDPRGKRSTIPNEIAGDLARKGISMDVDTVRKWLKQSAEFLPTSTEDDEPG